MTDSDLELGNDQSLSKSHSKLLENVSALDIKQRINKAVLTEPRTEVSEFHLVKSGITDNKKIVNITNLAKNLGKTAAHNAIKKQVLKLGSKSKTLPKPLEKPVADRIKRTVGFEKTKKDLARWNGIVARNRTIGHIQFPLTQPSLKMDPQYEMTSRCVIKSELEKEFEKLETPKQEMKLENEIKDFALTKGELLEKHREAARLRAQESYKASKARRLKKIKSKKFHRIQRKQKLKTDIKEFEELQKTDPEAALEKLEMLDKVRARERISLRHKNTGQWAKNLQVRAKYDQESRQALAQQLAISRELTQKLQKTDDTDEDDEEDQAPAKILVEDKENPWMNRPVKTNKEIDDFLSDYKKYWQNKNKEQKSEEEKEERKEENEQIETAAVNPVEYVEITNKIDKKKKTDKPEKKKTKVEKKKEKVTFANSEWIVEEDLDELFSNAEKHVKKVVDSKIKLLQEKVQDQPSKPSKKTRKTKKTKKQQNKKSSSTDYLEKMSLKPDILRPTFNEPMLEVANDRLSTSQSAVSNRNVIKTVEKNEINANSYIDVQVQHIKSQIPDFVMNGTLDDSEDDQNQLISEAFEDDDVVRDFKEEKEDEIKSNQPKDLDLTLPGWGCWGGKDIKISARKRKKFVIKAPKADKRKDENKGSVIIIEERDAKIKKHLVNELPFPFKNVTDFEANLRAPLGRDFVPERLHKKLIEPAVKTKMGKIIEPMDEDALVNVANKRRKFK